MAGSSILNNKKRGFTLIELMVVISIISLLSSVVLASVKSARMKAQDSKVKTQLLSIRNAAGLAMTSSGNYGNAGPTDFSCDGLVNNSSFGSLMLGSNWPNGVIPRCYSNALATRVITAYSMSQDLSNGEKWCVDSWNKSVSRTNYPNASNCKTEWATSNEVGTYTWDKAISQCAKKGMRLPSRDELYAKATVEPLVVPLLVNFGGTFWSSTEVTPNNAYTVTMAVGGGYGWSSKGSSWSVRCVQ